jgi:hypothetical protein
MSMSHPDDETPDMFDPTPFAVEWTADGHATEDSIYAWLDGALEQRDRDAMAAHVTGCSVCEGTVADARGYIAASARIMQAGDVASHQAMSADDVTQASARIVMAAERRAVPVTPPWQARTILRLAAGALFMLAGAAYLATREAGGERLVASESSRGSGVVAERDSTAAAQPIERVAATPPVVAVPAPTVEIPSAPVAAEPSPFTVTTLSGRVTDGNAPVAAASVLVPGTSLVAATDSLGRFTLRDVPSSATTLQARRIGYQAISIKLAERSSDSTPINFELTPSTLSLSSVVVTSVSPADLLRTARCLSAVADPDTRAIPLVRMLRGTMRDTGTHTLTVVGWPTAEASTQGTFVLDSLGDITGSTAQNDARLEFELSGDARSWLGTVTETRGSTLRTEEVEFVVDSSSQGCTRED